MAAAGTAAREKLAHLWEREPDNWYVEPVWVSRRLWEVERFDGRIVDPCAGLGRIVGTGRAAGHEIDGYDLRVRDVPGVLGVPGGFDFFADPDYRYLPGTWPCSAIVCNPPYGPSPRPGGRRLEEQFVERALGRTTRKVAALLPTIFLNGEARSRWLETTPLYRIWNCAPRPSCPPGPVVVAGAEGGSGTKDYSWFIWLHGYEGAPTVRALRRND